MTDRAVSFMSIEHITRMSWDGAESSERRGEWDSTWGYRCLLLLSVPGLFLNLGTIKDFDEINSVEIT